MKRFFLIFTLTLMAVNTISAQSYKIENRKDLDSLEYLLPNFSVGTVLFTDGQSTQALVNINTFDNGIRFIENNDTMTVKNEDEIKALYVKNKYYAKWQKRYIEILSPLHDTSLGISRAIEMIPRKATGAYGMVSETTSITSVPVISDGSGSYHRLKNGTDNEFKYVVTYYICKGNKRYVANKKGFQKIYPKLKDAINDFVKENKTDFEDLESLKALYQFCSE